MAHANDPSILVTGANGFVGQAVCAAMRKQHIDFLPVTRKMAPISAERSIVKDINPSTDWRADLKGVGAVVHLAARVHMVRDPSPDPLKDYRATNVAATLNLARQCADAGVKRFVFLSSVKVNGESTGARPFSVLDAPAPVDPYGISKHEAEQGLRALSRETGLDVVIIRPPLVYGPGVKANFLQLMRWVRRGIPLPLASVDNRRSMIFIGNLVDVILQCLIHEAASGRTFLVSDDHDVSIAELVRSIAKSMGRRPKLFPAPPAALMLAASLAGKAAMAQRLLDSLQVDIGPTKRILGWNPTYSFMAGIEQTVRHFIETNGVSSESWL